MDFIGSIQSGFKNYANFKGVASRSEYWYFVLFIVLSSLVLSVFDTFLSMGVLSNVFALVVLLPNLAVLVRRLRDAGFSWVWIMAPISSVVILFVGIFGIVSLGVQSGVLDWSALAEPESTINPQALEQLAADPNFLGFVLMTVLGLVFAGITSLVVNIIFPVLPSKTAAEGNKKIKPETL